MLQAVLRAAGLDVTPRELSTLEESDADVVVLAGDAPGALEALRRLRDDGPRPDALVVLVGAPPGLEPRSEGPAFGAEWALTRDAAPDRLARVVHDVAARADARALPRSHRERTLDLGRDESVVARVHEDQTGGRRIARVSDVAPSPEPGSGEHALRAPISLELEAILRAGAERALPGGAGVDVSLPAGEDAAIDLVPDEFVLAAPLIESDDEPVGDSLTFVGGPPPLAASRSGRASHTPGGTRASSPPPARTAALEARADGTRSAIPTGSSLPPRPYAGAAARERERERASVTTGAAPASAGSGTVVDLLRMMFEVARSGDERVLRIDGEVPLELALADGLLAQLRGPVAGRVLEALGQRAAGSETEAEGRLDALVLGGLVSPARRAREELVVRRALLDQLLGRARVAWKSLDDSVSPGRALPHPFARELADAAARTIDARRAHELGLSTSRLHRSAGFPAVAAALGAPLSLEVSLGDAGMSLARLSVALVDEPGLAGRVVALIAAGVLEARGVDADVPEDLAARARARTLVEDAARLAAEGDYFVILGLGPRDGAAAVESAYSERRGRLLALDLEGLGLTGLAGDRDVALSALAEARRILSVDRWREPYAAALARG